MSDDAMQPRDGMTGDGAEAPEASPVPTYDQEFFLKLARPRDDTDEARTEARERWNKWRRDPANAGVAVTFIGVDFRAEEIRGISFSGFEFGDRARFDGAKFGDGVRFDGSNFGDRASFVGSNFGNQVQFDDATFGEKAQFYGAVFGQQVQFNGATFGDEVRFNDVTFGDRVHFVGAKFGALANFADATFGKWAWFIAASFEDDARFTGATFDVWARFNGANFGDGASFASATGERDVEARGKGWAEREEGERKRLKEAYRKRREAEGFSPATFSDLSFAGAHFFGAVSFARRSFERPANFTDVRFDEPPDFDGATNLQRIDFTGARATFALVGRPWLKRHWTTDSRIAIRLRALRSQIEATKNHDFERDLYIEERKAERGIHLARLWKNLRHRRLIKTALAYVGGLPRLPKVDIFAERGEPVVRWPEPPRNRRGDARPAMIGDGPAAVRLRRAYRRNGARFLAALGPLLGHLLWIAVMAVYWALSDYGRSWLRPALCLGVVLVLFHGLGPVDGITARALGAKRVEIVAAAETARPGSGGEVGSAWDEAAKLYAVANSIPFVGPLTIDGEVKKFLFCGAPPAPTAGAPAPAPCIPLPPAALQAATIAQNLLSILLVFFIGLALRNYFRLK